MVSARPIASKAWSTPPGDEREDRLDGAAVRRVDGVRGAAAERELELARVAVDGDHARRPGERRGGDDLQADAAAAEHADGVPGADPRGVRHGADAGHHRAADERRLPQRQAVRERDGARLRDHAALGEAGDEVEVLERGAAGQPQP